MQDYYNKLHEGRVKMRHRANAELELVLGPDDIEGAEALYGN